MIARYDSEKVVTKADLVRLKRQDFLKIARDVYVKLLRQIISDIENEKFGDKIPGMIVAKLNPHPTRDEFSFSALTTDNIEEGVKLLEWASKP